MTDKKIPFPTWVALVPFLLALATRAVYLVFWLDSPFRNYHQVGGLDMRWHVLRAQEVADGECYKSLYLLLLSLPYKLGWEDNSAVAIVVVQLFLGAVSAGLIAYIAARFFRSGGWGALTGCLFAVYAPLLIYEGALLKETIFLFANVFSLALLVYVLDQRHSARSLFVAGMGLVLPALIRPMGLAWVGLGSLWLLFTTWRQLRSDGTRLSARVWRLSFLPLGAAVVIATIALHNQGDICGLNVINSHYLGYVRGVVTRTGELSLNTSPPQDASAEVEASANVETKPSSGRLRRMLTKFLHLFRADELPDNLNYFFMKFRIAPLTYLLGPWLLMPLVVAGLPLLLARRSRIVRASLLLTYAAAYAVPLTLFMPLGRYKIQLLPLYCVAAVFLIRYCRAMARRRRWLRLVLPTGLLLAAFGANWAAQEPSKLRASDFHAYAVALSRQGAGPEEIQANLQRALELRPDSANAATMLAHLYMSKGDFALAHQLVVPFYRSHPENSSVTLAYAAALLGMRQAAEAERVLLRLDAPQEGAHNRKAYFYNLGECRLLQGDPRTAAAHYLKAAACAEPAALDQSVAKRLKLVGGMLNRNKPAPNHP